MKIALVENFGSDFYGARLRYALFLKQKGHQIVAIVPNDGYVEKIQDAGVEAIAINIDIRKRNIGSMLIFASQLRKIFMQQNFDVIHFYRMQPNLIGTPVAFFSSRKSDLINHITGLGVAFTKSSLKFNLIKFVIKNAYKMNSKIFNAKLIFQNVEDRTEIGIKDKKAVVVKGSAVDEDRFNPFVRVNESLRDEIEKKIALQGSINLIFVSRLLMQKGLSFLIEAIEQYNASAPLKKANLIVAGWIDPNNPDSFAEKEIEHFGKNSHIVFLGRRSDVNELISLADIATLPTYYREGTPRFLLEAMAMAKPILTTDMPGCNHLVENNENGVLVRPKDVVGLVRALSCLSGQDLKDMGEKSLQIYNEKFSEEVVYNQLLKTYIS